MKLKQVLITILLSGLVSLASLLVYQKLYKTKTAYIEIKKVFDCFQMKAEIEVKYNQTKKIRDKMLDSLSFNLKVMSRHLNEQKNAKSEVDKEEVYQFEYKREEYLKLKNQFEEDNAALSQKYDAQILSRLTQYVIDFGKKNNYDIIFGADGNGNLMYSKDVYNISDEVIIFINNKYKGID